MFTGIIETRGSVVSRTESAEGVRFVIVSDLPFENVALGESIAVNGCCLTVVAFDGLSLSFDLLQETVARTNLKSLAPGASVNLERAMRADARLGGHFVTGHIDGTAPILRWEDSGKGDYLLEIGLRPGDDAYLIPKGSICIDGISLTVGEVTKTRFTVWIIPHTRQVTNLMSRRPGEEVNLEFDMLAKYVVKLIEAKTAQIAAAPAS
ncbi:riboflavin synthase alpha chain [Verrucomicrobium sp. GAS474]|uniref:riboflavin synthase n=1 Tax=Verrucomicrobium sp. GAS474 TaxID=1882831 RepID=UPI00087A028F|nr:riboflavin synthase [Verrucomicrobium sp. GAS474]SDU16396.1 riboflavin synthase alpha chain [Verrucomicrobium sp. GAS474]